MLVLGLLTPLAAGACMGVMLVAWITNHLRNGFFIFRPGEGWEYVANLAVASLAIGALGAGQWSLDNAIDFALHGWRGFIAALVIGVGGSAALLVTFWRPPRPRRGEGVAPSARELGDEERHDLAVVADDADVGGAEDQRVGFGVDARARCRAARTPIVWLNLPLAPMLTNRRGAIAAAGDADLARRGGASPCR